MSIPMRLGERGLDVPSPNASLAHFFDFDGTLVELAPTPSSIRLDARLMSLIAALYEASNGAVAIITGRPIADIDRLFATLSLPVAGQHGVERRNATGNIVRHAFPTDALDEARERLRDVVSAHPRLLLEDKGMSIALHYRGAPALAGFAHRVMHETQRRLGERFTVQTGKRVVELKPVGRDKGVAILEFMQEPPFRGRTPIFVGDDATDEYGFAVTNLMHGHSVKVGRGPSTARWRLSDVDAVREWLTRGIHAATPAEGAAQ